MLKIRNTWSQKGDLQQQATTSGLALLAPIKAQENHISECMSTRTTVQDQERGTGARKSVNEGAPTKNGLSNKERLDLKREFPTTNYRRNGSISRELGCGINSNFGKIHHSACTFCVSDLDNAIPSEEDNHIKFFIPQARIV